MFLTQVGKGRKTETLIHDFMLGVDSAINQNYDNIIKR